MTVKFTFLGTGSVKAAPVYGCECVVCQRALANTDYRRHPACGVLEVNGLRLLIDAGYHNLEQKFPPGSLDAVLLTHFHMDHVQGLFPMRWGMGKTIPVFSPDDPAGCDDLFKYPGIFDFSQKSQPFETFSFQGLNITPVPLVHSKLTMGYVIEVDGKRLAYLCDSGTLRRDVEDYLQRHPIDLMILDCDQPPLENAPRNHNDLTRALQIFEKVKPKQLVLTHISHNLDEYFMHHPDCLPENVHIGYDNQAWSI
ncbi:MAG: phosphonate metabolism protein PhnP [Pseudomonadota bacterium]|nr:phosphonate metabolism protein PhnP [Pseudomonadota bacterium]